MKSNVFLGDGMPMLRRLVDGSQPDLVFNFAEGSGSGRSREARVPAVLEMLGIPYTGSDPSPFPLRSISRVPKATRPRRLGLRRPIGSSSMATSAEFRSLLAAMPLPVIVKPACEEFEQGHPSDAISSKSPVDCWKSFEQMAALYRQPVLVEEFIDGEELTVGIVGHRPPKSAGDHARRYRSIRPGRPFIYNLEVKRNMDLSPL